METEKPLEILLIEDNEGDVELARFAFKKCGLKYNLHVAYDGVEGVEYLKKEGDFADAMFPDIVLLDLNMPRMSGKEVLDVMKNDDELKVIPVVVFTSSQAKSDVVESYQKHANCYIIKPAAVDSYIEIAQQIIRYWSGLTKLPTAVDPLQFM